MHSVIFGKKLPDQEYRERTAIYGLLQNEMNQIGIVKTARGGVFLPGGGLKEGESHSECLKREFIEETGLGIEVGEYIDSGVLYDFAPTIQQYLKMIGHFYKVKCNGTTFDKTDHDHQFEWIDIFTAIEKMTLEHQAWAIRKMMLY